MRTFVLITLLAMHTCVYGQDSTEGKKTLWQKLHDLNDKPSSASRHSETAVKEEMLPADPNTRKVSYADIVEAPGSRKAGLFNAAKKWILTKNSPTNPYMVSFENEAGGSVTGKGTFMLPGNRRNYAVLFTINIGVKDGKYRYDFTDFMIQYKTEAGSSGGGYAYWGHSSYHEAQTLEYSLETFYPSRLRSHKPSIKWYEEIDKKSFRSIDQTMESIVGSLKEAMSVKQDW
jgi:hypothetical protein